jgi:hypothetical protein
MCKSSLKNLALWIVQELNRTAATLVVTTGDAYEDVSHNNMLLLFK